MVDHPATGTGVLDRPIADAIAAWPRQTGIAWRLCTPPSIGPGIGPVAAASLIADLPELGRLDPRALAAPVGLARFENETGSRPSGPRCGERLCAPGTTTGRLHCDVQN